MRRALVASAGSIAFHGGVVAIAVLVAALKREPHAVPSTDAAPVNTVDVWSGVTAAIGGERLVDVNVDALGGQVGIAGAAAKAAEATPPPAPATPPPPPKAAIHAVPAPKPAAEKPALPDDPAAIEPAPRPRAKKAKSIATDPAVSSAAADPGDVDEKPAPPASPRATKRKAGGGAGGENGDGAKLGPFGAEGPSAVRSLGRGFARSIAAACVGDSGWGKLPVGDVGAIDVAITVDESGRITGSRALDRDPPKQLLALVKRTIALIDSGTFELKGSVSAGVEILHIQASVSDVATDVEGGATALSFGEGKAAFTQEGGRHVEVTIRVVKVEAAVAP
jgi:outer membrane biosynthesis protein TonB